MRSGSDVPAGGRRRCPGRVLRDHLWWWLVPLAVVLALLLAIVALSPSYPAPFLYTNG